MHHGNFSPCCNRFWKLLYSMFSSQCVWESHQTYFQIISNLHQIVEGLVGFFVCALVFCVENIGVPQITMMLNWISLQTYVKFLKVSSTECKAQLQVPNLSNFIEDNISEMEILSNKLSEDEIREMRGGQFVNYTPGIPSHARVVYFVFILIRYHDLWLYIWSSIGPLYQEPLS